MKDHAFDTVVRGLHTVRSRREAVALLVGGGALVGLGEAEARKRGKAKGKGKGKGKGKAKGKTKVFICHGEPGSYELIRVGAPGVKGHRKHGDTICGPAGPCQTGDPTGCDQVSGACTFASVADDTPCTTEGGQAGTCTAGICA